MKELILVAFYWTHLVATVIWIGGIIFILFIAMPSAKQVLGVDAGRLMGEIAKRFTPLANYCILLLVISGLALTGLSRDLSGPGASGDYRATALILKYILVSGMIIVHFYRGLALAPRIIRTTSDIEKTALQKLSVNLVRVNFGLGLLVLLFSGIAHIF